MKIPFWTFLMTLCAISHGKPILAKDDAADVYKRYVDNIIPLTFSLADQEAKIRENAIFTNQIAAAQQKLVLASAAQNDITMLFKEIRKLDINQLCKINNDNETAFLETAKYLSYLGQLLNAKKVIERTIAAFDKLRASIDLACNETTGFESYDVKNLNFDAAKPVIETIDGVYIEFGDPIRTTISIGQSIYQAFSNNSVQNRVNEQLDRLKVNRAKTQDYQKLAQLACRSQIETSKTVIQEIDSAALEIKNIAKLVDPQQIEPIIKSLLHCFNQFEKLRFETLLANVHEYVNAETKQHDISLVRHKQIFEFYNNLYSTIFEFKKSPCGDGANAIIKIRSAQSFANGIHLVNSKLFTNIESELSKRAAKCGGEYL